MSKQQVQELNINGVPSSLNLSNIGAYINNGTTNIEIKKYIDDKVKSASGNTGGGGGGTVIIEGGSKVIAVDNENFNTVEERREAFEYIRTLTNENKFDGRYTFVMLEPDDYGNYNKYSTFIKFFPSEYEDAVYFYRAHCTPDGTGGFQIHRWTPNYPEEGKYLTEWVGGRDPLYEGARNTYSIHNWGMYDDGSTWHPINYNRDFYEIVNPTRFTHMGKVWEKQIPYQPNIIPTREDWDNAASDYYTIMEVGRYLFNPSYGLIGNELSYGRLVAYEPSTQWRIIKYEYEWCKVKLYRAFVEDNILKIQFGVVNLDDSDDYSWGGMWEIDGWKERWEFTQLEDQEITLEPYRLTMENVNSVYPKENAFYIYK